MGGEGGTLAQFNNSVVLWEPAMCLTYIEPRALRAQSIHWQQRDHRVGEDLPPCLPTACQDLPLGATGAGSTGAVLGEAASPPCCASHSPSIPLLYPPHSAALAQSNTQRP